jgi:short-subunit dehydrogenase
MKNIMIIGATSAIAAACCRHWSDNQTRFFLVGRDANKLSQTAADLRSRGANEVIEYPADLSSFASHPLALQCFLTHYSQIDICLIAHGTLPNQRECETDLNQALAEFNINGTSIISLLTTLAPQFERQRCGKIAVISSVAGDRGRQSNYVYGAAKAAVTAFTAGLRMRLHKLGVHVMTVKPGFVDTPMTQGLDLPKALLASADQVGKSIVRGLDKNTDVLYTPRVWLLIMTIVKCIPNFVFKRLSM